jgi:hypothetical protein
MSGHGPHQRTSSSEKVTPAAQVQAAREKKPIWEIIAEIGASVPPEAWEDVPRDLAINHDHYLYGTPKVED